MFSKNLKISNRQVKRMLIMDLFGIGSLLLPTALAKITGSDGIFSIAIGSVLGLIYVNLICEIIKTQEGSYYACLRQNYGKLFGGLCGLFYLIYILFASSYFTYLLTKLITQTLVEHVADEWIVLLILGLSGYGIISGIEGRARMGEILFLVVFIPVGCMFLLASKDVNMEYWLPVFMEGTYKIGVGTYLVFVIFSISSFLLFFTPYLKEVKKIKKMALSAASIVGVAFVGIYFILLGIFQVNGMGVQEFPVITLMTMIKLPGGFLQRQDAFMVAAWFFCIFSLLATCNFFGSRLIKELSSCEGERKYVLLFQIAVFMVTIWFLREDSGIAFFHQFVLWIGTPALVLIPLLLICIIHIRGRRKVV